MGDTTCEAYGDMCPMPSTLKQLEAMPGSCFLLHNRREQTTHTRPDLGHRPFRNTLRVEPRALTKKPFSPFQILRDWAPVVTYLYTKCKEGQAVTLGVQAEDWIQ